MFQKQKSGDEDSYSEEEEEDSPEPDATLFVKNLNFSTTEEALREVTTVTPHQFSNHLCHSTIIKLLSFNHHKTAEPSLNSCHSTIIKLLSFNHHKTAVIQPS